MHKVVNIFRRRTLVASKCDVQPHHIFIFPDIYIYVFMFVLDDEVYRAGLYQYIELLALQVALLLPDSIVKPDFVLLYRGNDPPICSKIKTR